jgi:hypothetical protein
MKRSGIQFTKVEQIERNQLRVDVKMDMSTKVLDKMLKDELSWLSSWRPHGKL